MTEPTISALAVHGPFALVSGVLIWQVLKAWQADRETIVSLMTDFRQSLDGVQRAIERLADQMSDHRGTRSRR
ncbi:MAG: hypothetical protein KF812_02285 [Fimbriimonadaceae bacterium]|nr:hypothetical protein [Fimbriimonadaceae bacterium]